MYKNIFLFTSIFTIIVLIILNAILGIQIESIFVYLFAFVFVFFIAYILQTIKKDFKIYDFDLSWINIIKYITVLIYIILTYKFIEYNILSEIIIGYILFCLLFLVDSRISFLIALCFLSFVPVYLIIWDNTKAENLSIYAYYFLIIWVIISIYENYYFDKFIDNWNKND